MPDGTRTVLSKATSNSASLRATVPAWVIEQFKLEVGDSLFWQIDAQGSKLRLIVEPCKKASLEKK